MKFEGICLRLALAAAAAPAVQSASLQILHSSDHESSFQDPNTLEEKIIGYSSVVSGLQQLAAAEGMPSIHVTAGDFSIPGPFYQAAAEVPQLASPGLGDIAMFDAFPNTAMGLGNHEFDGGINEFAAMVNAAQNFPFVAVNLDFSNVQLEPGTPAIQIGPDAGPCSDVAGQIVKSCHLTAGNLTVGIIGRSPFDLFNVVEDPATTIPGLDFVGGRDPDTNQPLESAVPGVLEQVDLLTAQGASVIILLDHAQDFTGDPLSAEVLRGIDVIVSAGSTGFLANEPNGPFNYLREGDSSDGAYPAVLTDSEGKTILLVNTDQQYKYVGNLIVEFDDAGDVVGWDMERSGPIATTSEAVDLLAVEIGVDTIDPIAEVRDTLDLLQATDIIQAGFEVIGTTMTPLNGERASVRTRETNLGQLAADSTLWEGNMFAEANGLSPVDIALKNGGGIRDNILGPSITRLAVEASLAFDNTLALVELTATQLIAAMENSVSRVPEADGRFPQVAGLMMEFDASFPGMEGMVELDTPSRVRSLTIMKADGTEDMLIANFTAMGDLNRTFVMATNSFQLTGGDGYASLPAGIPLGETEIGEQQILIDYIQSEWGGDVNLEDPPSEPRVIQNCSTIAELALAAGTFNTLLSLVEAAGLMEAIDVPGPITLFAPTDEAFAMLPDGALDALIQDPIAVVGVLTYHVIGGAVLTSDLTDGQTIVALNQIPLTVSVSDMGVMINDAPIVNPDLRACNGVIQVLGGVLIPPAAGEEPTAAPVDMPTAEPVASGSSTPTGGTPTGGTEPTTGGATEGPTAAGSVPATLGTLIAVAFALFALIV